VSAWVPDMFCDFYLVSNYKTANTSTTTKATEKMNTHLKSLEFETLLGYVLQNLKTINFT